MADSIRTKIISAMDTRFKGILVASGYETNVGNHVFAWKETPFEASDLPALNYRDRTENKESLSFSHQLNILTVEVDIFSETLAEIRKILADIEKAIATDLTWSGNAMDTELNLIEMAVEQNENLFSGQKISVIVFFKTQHGNPYA